MSEAMYFDMAELAAYEFDMAIAIVTDEYDALCQCLEQINSNSVPFYTEQQTVTKGWTK